MTSPPARSCPSCGAGLATDAAFCTVCGTPAPPTGPTDHTAFRRPGAEPAATPPGSPAPVLPPRSDLPPPLPPFAPPVDVVEAGPLERPRPRRRQTIGVLVALVVVGALAAGGIVASTWGGTDAEVYGYGGHVTLPDAVTEEPQRDWTWDIAGSLTGLAATGDTTYVATDDGRVTALDGNGRERWSTDTHGSGYPVGVPDHDAIVLFEDMDGPTVTALSSDDGDELWSADGYVQWVEDDRAYVATGQDLVAYDLGSGDEVWTASADTIGVGEAGVFVLVDDELRRVDTDDGRTMWTVDVVRPSEMTTVIAVADDFVAVGGRRALAFDAADGRPLWSADGPEVAVQLFSRDEVAVVDMDGDDRPVPLYDRDGADGSIKTGGFFYGVPFRSGDDEYTFGFDSGELYQGHRAVATYDGQVTLAAEGLYLVDKHGLGYYEYGAADPTWTLDDDLSGGLVVESEDGRLLVADADELRSYS